MALVEAVVGVVLVGVVVWATLRWRRARTGIDPDRPALRPLVPLLVVLLAALSGVSLLLWGLFLQSNVAQYADVRCIVGVLRVGEGSEGAAGWLPLLATATTFLRLALLFGAGAALALHRVSLDRPEGALPPAHAVLLVLVGLTALAGAATETAYVSIPRESPDLSNGCCATTAVTSTPEYSTSLGASDAAPVRTVLLGVPMIGLFAVAAGGWRRRHWGALASDLARLVLGAAYVVAGSFFLTEILAPVVLGLPFHRCVACLVVEAPEMLAGIALLATPVLAFGWRTSIRWLAGGGRGPNVIALERRLDRTAIGAFVGGPLFFAAAWMAS